MLYVHQLSKRFGADTVLNRITFELPKGKILGLLGPNGAGKTTLLNILSTFMAPDSGTVDLGGYNLITEPECVRRIIGYLPEQPPLDQQMTVGEYLSFVSVLKGASGANRSSISASREKWLRRLELSSVKNRMISRLSKGYAQRVGLCQALIGDPELLLLDEPAVGLDPLQNRSFHQLLKALTPQQTIVISSHILTDVESVADTVVILDHGKVLKAEMDGRSDKVIMTEYCLVTLPMPEKIKKAVRNLQGVHELSPAPELTVRDDTVCTSLWKDRYIAYRLSVRTDLISDESFGEQLFFCLAKEHHPIIHFSTVQTPLEYHYFKALKRQDMNDDDKMEAAPVETGLLERGKSLLTDKRKES